MDDNQRKIIDIREARKQAEEKKQKFEEEKEVKRQAELIDDDLAFARVTGILYEEQAPTTIKETTPSNVELEETRLETLPSGQLGMTKTYSVGGRNEFGVPSTKLPITTAASAPSLSEVKTRTEIIDGRTVSTYTYTTDDSDPFEEVEIEERGFLPEFLRKKIEKGTDFVRNTRIGKYLEDLASPYEDIQEEDEFYEDDKDKGGRKR